MILLFLQGYFLGVINSVPIGPVNVICLNQTMQNGQNVGFKATIGATVADMIFAIIASMGVKSFINFINENRMVFEFGSGIILLAFGIFLLLKSPQRQFDTNKNTIQDIGNYFKSFLFTISNPLTILFFVAYLTLLGEKSFNVSMAVLFVSGVVMGSLSWFYSLSRLIEKFKHSFANKHYKNICIGCACVLCISGLVFLLKPMFENIQFHFLSCSIIY